MDAETDDQYKEPRLSSWATNLVFPAVANTAQMLQDGGATVLDILSDTFASPDSQQAPATSLTLSPSTQPIQVTSVITMLCGGRKEAVDTLITGMTQTTDWFSLLKTGDSLE